MPKLDFLPYDGRIPTGDKLKRVVENLLNDQKQPADAVIALTDVYTGSIPPEFPTAERCKAKDAGMGWCGETILSSCGTPRLRGVAAAVLGENQEDHGKQPQCPWLSPEKVDHDNSPAYRLAEVFRTGSKTKSYVKARDAGRILKDEDLSVAIDACPELKAFVETIVTLCSPK